MDLISNGFFRRQFISYLIKFQKENRWKLNNCSLYDLESFGLYKDVIGVIDSYTNKCSCCHHQLSRKAFLKFINNDQELKKLYTSRFRRRRHILKLSNCYLDPDQGTYYLDSSDPIFQDYVRKNMQLFERTNWIAGESNSEDGYSLEINAGEINTAAKRQGSFKNCRITFDWKRNVVDIVNYFRRDHRD